MMTEDPPEAVAHAVAVLSTSRLMPDQTPYELLSRDIITAMLKRITDMSQRYVTPF